MSRTTPAPDLILAAPEVAREFACWLAYLSTERRMSPKTVEAYERDLRQFLGFLSGHLDGRVTLSALARLAPLDVRAFLAARRADGIGSRSLMRMLAGVRSFARFLERNGKGKVGALAAVRTPKIAKTLPKPLAIAAAKRMADTDLRAGEERDPWILARDAAVLALLYGSGLRISEALALKRSDIPAPGGGDVITVTGKGNKARMVPVLARSPSSQRTTSRSARTSFPPTVPCSSAPRAARSPRASSSLRWRACAARSACRRARHHTRCDIPSQRTCWRAAATCGRSRSCSATPRCRRRRSTPRSIPNGCWKSIAARIHGHDAREARAHRCTTAVTC